MGCIGSQSRAGRKARAGCLRMCASVRPRACSKDPKKPPLGASFSALGRPCHNPAMNRQDLLFDEAAGAAGSQAPAALSGTDAPLAERLRPEHLDEVIGQPHLLGTGKTAARGL